MEGDKNRHQAGGGRHSEPQRRTIALGQIFRSVEFCYTLAENIIRQCFHCAELINTADPSHLTLAQASPLLSQREQNGRKRKGGKVRFSAEGSANLHMKPLQLPTHTGRDPLRARGTSRPRQPPCALYLCAETPVIKDDE